MAYLETDDLAGVPCPANTVLPVWWDLVRTIFGQYAKAIHEGWIGCICWEGRRECAPVVGGKT